MSYFPVLLSSAEGATVGQRIRCPPPRSPPPPCPRAVRTQGQLPQPLENSDGHTWASAFQRGEGASPAPRGSTCLLRWRGPEWASLLSVPPWRLGSCGSGHFPLPLSRYLQVWGLQTPPCGPGNVRSGGKAFC